MTECERIIADGILPEHFFEEELRCGFLVTRERKEIWAVGLDLLLKFDEVCRKHGLQYFLFFGSLLGAVRHDGFIPWDDDIDVVMPRKDYNAFLRLRDEFSAPYFLQTPYTDPGYYYTYVKLRNSNTTEIDKPFRYQNINWGFALDIYPVDHFPLEGGRERYDRVSRLAKANSLYMRSSAPGAPRPEGDAFQGMSGDPLERYEEIHRIVSQFEDQPCECVSIAALTFHSYEHNVFHSADFREAVLWHFEQFSFPIPNGYHGILSVLYGDYMTFPPEENRTDWHSKILFDADVPYGQYCADRAGIGSCSEDTTKER